MGISSLVRGSIKAAPQTLGQDIPALDLAQTVQLHFEGFLQPGPR